jgi:hypothetical protein
LPDLETIPEPEFRVDLVPPLVFKLKFDLVPELELEVKVDLVPEFELEVELAGGANVTEEEVGVPAMRGRGVTPG